MSETAIAAPATTTTPAATGTGGETSAEPKITYGSPEGNGAITETRESERQTDDAGGISEADRDEFGEFDEFADFGDDETEIEPEKFTSEQYKALKQALAQNPELFKAVKREISENSRYKQVYESPEVARQFADRVEALGGIDGIEQESAEWSKVFQMFQSGDPGVIDYWAKDNPQALSKLFPHVYDRIAQSDPAMWGYKAAGTFMATAQQQGMLTAIETLSKLKAVADSPEAKNLVNSLIESFNRIDAVSQKAPTQDLTPEAQKLSEREKQLKQQETDIYQRGVSQQVAPLVRKAANNALSAMLKGRNLKPDAKAELLKDVNREFSTLQKKDENFQKNAKALLAAGETEKFVKLVDRKSVV